MSRTFSRETEGRFNLKHGEKLVQIYTHTVGIFILHIRIGYASNSARSRDVIAANLRLLCAQCSCVRVARS